VTPTKATHRLACLRQSGYLHGPGSSHSELADDDGAKDLYLPILQLLTPRLRRGSVVLADNIFLFRRALAPYVAHVCDPRNGFSSVTLFLGSGTEYSLRL